MPSCCASRYVSLSLCATQHASSSVQVDSPQSLENVETKWKSEIEENCPGVRIVLVALKCDLREANDDDETGEPKRPMIEYKQGLQVAQHIKALRYLECSAMKNRGVKEAFNEAAKVALSVKNPDDKTGSKCVVM